MKKNDLRTAFPSRVRLLRRTNDNLVAKEGFKTSLTSDFF
jgi:hypothetical protein